MSAESQPSQTVGGEGEGGKTVLIHELPDHLHAMGPMAQTTASPAPPSHEPAAPATSAQPSSDPDAHAVNSQDSADSSPSLSAENTALLVASSEPTPDPGAQTEEEQAAGTPLNKTVLIHELPDHLDHSDDPSGPALSPAPPSEPTLEPETLMTEEESTDYPMEAAAVVEWVEPEVSFEEQPETVDEWGVRAGTQIGPRGHGGAPGSGDQVRRRKVLVIDDDATMRMVLGLGLRSHGFDCLMAENGKEAQTVLQKHRPDLILVDLMMPVMDGLTFIQWLRQTAGDSTPVLVFTNVNTPKITEEALATGANAFACKPLHLSELVEVMNQLAPH